MIALPLDRAKERLASTGFSVEIERTYPTKPAKGRGIWRVVRQTEQNGTILLVVAEECEGVV